MSAVIKKRPRSVAEVASRTLAKQDSFDRAVLEFLDSFYLMPSQEEREASIKERPELIAPLQDAYLGAVAEHLARLYDLEIPEWTDESNRFLRRPFFAGKLESLKATLLVESPSAFRRRMIFVSANALSRPRERSSDEVPLRKW